MRNFFIDHQKRIHISLGLTLLLCLLIISWLKSFNLPIHDFANYYFSSLSIANGHVFDLYDPVKFNLFAQSIAATDVFANYSPHPPFTKLFFLPFTMYNVLTSKLIFSLLGIILFCISLIRLSRQLSDSTSLYWLIPLVFFIPLQNNIYYGQTYLWLFFLLTECYLASEKKQNYLSAFYLSLAVLIKLTPLLLIVYFISRKHYRIALYSVVLVVLYVCIDIGFSGIQQWSIFASEIVSRSSEGLVNVTMSPHFQSLNVLTKYLFLQDLNYNPSPIFTSEAIMYFLNYSISGFLIISAFLIGRKSTSFQAFSFWIAVLLFVTPIGSTYSQILYAFIFMAFFQSTSNKALLIAIGILFFLSSNSVTSFGLELFYLNFMRLFLLTFILFYFIFKQGKDGLIYSLGIALLIGISAMFIKSFPTVDGIAELEEDNTVVANKITRIDNEVFIHYLDGNGISKKRIESIGPIESYENLKINEDGSVKGLSLNFKNPDNITQAVMINDKDLYFLSDSRHGYHFYQLRKISL